MCFQPLGEPKNAEKRSSSADEMQKSRENAHRRSTKREKREKVLVVGRRNAEIVEKRSSSADETQKSLKNARRRLTKRKKRRKTVFRTPTTSKKTLKTAFCRGTINKKRQKQPFVGVRRTENAKNRVS